jgi:two-component system CheB/CheR fusion protein
MYFTSELQKRVLASFHFALNPDGYLFLGKSEVLVARSSLFAPVDLKKRVFAKAGQRQLAPPAPAAGPIVRLERPPEPATDALVREAGADAAPIAQVIVERSGKLVFANLQARILFGIGAREIGAPFKDLELSYRPVELRSRIDQALSERHPISIHEVEWRSDSQTRWFDLQVTPLVSSRGEPLGAAITFTDVTRFKELQDALEVSKRDLETAYEELQSTVEELETTNEELQSTNEELETTNEELQSTNEELETMNEELQSTNEELETINDELQLRTDELNTANAFLESILATVDAGVIVVDADFDIAAWNPGSEELWGLREDEVVGSNVFGLDIGLPVHELRSGMRDALDGNEVEPVVVAATNRRGRALRCHVTFSRLNGPDGLVRGVILFVLEEPKEHES